jgi:hypothetical protein
VQTGRHRTSFPRAPLVAIGCHGTTHGRVDGRVQYLTATFVPNSASELPLLPTVVIFIYTSRPLSTIQSSRKYATREA